MTIREGTKTDKVEAAYSGPSSSEECSERQRDTKQMFRRKTNNKRERVRR